VKTVTGSFQTYWGRCAADATLELELSEKATVIETGEVIDSPYVIPLDENGAIPPDTQIPGNDELSPEGTYYEVRVSGNWCGVVYGERQYIVGPSPIDLIALPRKSDVDEERERQLHPAPQPKPPRALPFLRTPGTNYHGFYGAVIHCPANVGRCTLPFAGNGKFAVSGFHLPFKSAVNAVSILVDKPRPENHVLVGLYNGRGEKVCSAAIDASKSGVAFAELESTVDLDPGDYFLTWVATHHEIEVRGIGGDYADQFRLANGGEGTVVVGIASVLGDGTLPDTLGTVAPHPCVPILAYFKA
jgi:hypothetical protein